MTTRTDSHGATAHLAVAGVRRMMFRMADAGTRRLAGCRAGWDGGWGEKGSG